MCILAIASALSLVASCAASNFKQAETQEKYVIVRTNYAAIKFQPGHLSEIKRCLDISDFKEMDVLYKEVFNFLKKWLGDEKTVLTPVRVGITIYASPRRLDKVYRSLGGKEAWIEGFYAAGTGEVYISLWHLNWEHLAHELAHHIVKKEFGLNLPEEKEEELARCAGEFL